MGKLSATSEARVVLHGEGKANEEWRGSTHLKVCLHQDLNVNCLRVISAVRFVDSEFLLLLLRSENGPKSTMQTMLEAVSATG